MAGELPDYVEWIKRQKCRMWMHDPCLPVYPADAHHAGVRADGAIGLAMRDHDDTCIPLCRKHHTAWHSASGPFRHWNKAKRHEWARRQIAMMRDRWERYMDMAGG